MLWRLTCNYLVTCHFLMWGGPPTSKPTIIMGSLGDQGLVSYARAEISWSTLCPQAPIPRPFDFAWTFPSSSFCPSPHICILSFLLLSPPFPFCPPYEGHVKRMQDLACTSHEWPEGTIGSVTPTFHCLYLWRLRGKHRLWTIYLENLQLDVNNFSGYPSFLDHSWICI